MTETIHTTTPEHVEQYDIDVAIYNAVTTVAEIAFDPEFQAYIEDNNLRLDPNDQLTYWWNVAGYTDTFLENNQSLPHLDAAAFALVANLPNAIIASYDLKRNDEHVTRLTTSRHKVAKQTACAYNDLLKRFVTAYPQKSSSLQANLLEATLATAGEDSQDIMLFANKDIPTRLKGIRYEVGFGAILGEISKHTDLTYRSATIEEDLNGRDFVVAFHGNEYGVDVKASTSEVDVKNNGANNTPYAMTKYGNIVIWPLLEERDFNGGFTPSTEHVERIWPVVAGYLQAATIQNVAK